MGLLIQTARRLALFLLVGGVLYLIPRGSEIGSGIVLVVLILAMVVAVPIVLLLFLAPILEPASGILKKVLEITHGRRDDL